ncbi:unnamed protein product [Closterium sp. NIES-54]
MAATIVLELKIGRVRESYELGTTPSTYKPQEPSVSLFDLAPSAATAPPATADSATRSLWLTRDAAARLAIRNHLPLAECAHFRQHRTAQALYDAVVARYFSPATAALGSLLLPYMFPELSAFATVEDLPPMFITLYLIVICLPDSLRSVWDHFLSLDPTSLSVDLLEQHLLAGETSAVAVGAARGTPCPTSELRLLVRSAAEARARVARVVEVAAAVVEVAAGVVVGAAVEVVAAAGLVEGVGALVAAVEAAVGVAAVAAVGRVAVGLELGVVPPDPGIAATVLGASESGTFPGQVAASCSCRLLSHQTLLWHHRLGHPSLPRLRGMHSRLLVSGLRRSLPPLPPSPAPPCLSCVEGLLSAALA